MATINKIDQEKLHTLLNWTKMTSSQFADNIEVPRSSISHILSTRNKMSLDIARKIIKKYREVSFEWLCSETFYVPEFLKTEPIRPSETKNDTKDPSSESSRKNYSSPKYEYENFATTDPLNDSSKKPMKIMIIYNDNTMKEILL